MKRKVKYGGGYYLTLGTNPKTCVWCGNQFKKSGSLKKTVEHILPVSFGGRDGNTNLTSAHLICNARRRRKTNWRPFNAGRQKMSDDQLSLLDEVRQLKAAGSETSQD